MSARKLQHSMYEVLGASMAQRLTMAGFVAMWVAMAWWLLFGGLEMAAHRLGSMWQPGDLARRIWLGTALTVYFVRILFTQFVFLKRGISWKEVFAVVSWLLLIYLLIGIAGGRNPAPFAVIGTVGIALFAVGSWINSYSEYARYLWKQRPTHHGKLYTGGLFRYSRHPNYFGDLVSFSGLCMISGSWVTAIIPIIMLAGFVFVNVPMLDSYLHDRYGADFDQYASRTPKLIPFIF